MLWSVLDYNEVGICLLWSVTQLLTGTTQSFLRSTASEAAMPQAAGTELWKQTRRNPCPGEHPAWRDDTDKETNATQNHRQGTSVSQWWRGREVSTTQDHRQGMSVSQWWWGGWAQRQICRVKFKSERERQIYIKADTGNLENRYWWTHLQEMSEAKMWRTDPWTQRGRRGWGRLRGWRWWQRTCLSVQGT